MRLPVLTIMIFIGATAARSGNLKQQQIASYIIGNGQMPDATTDNKGNIHIVFGTGDSIMYSLSNNQGRSFSQSILVSVLPKLAASAMRGPLITATSKGLTIIACNKKGDIFSYSKSNSEGWVPGGKINDVDTVAKEGLMALSGDGETAYAVWLDLRDKHNKIFGSRSADGGKSWSKNIMIYSSPDSTVCECCKPCVSVKSNNVFVMFRNSLNGNRDLHLIKSNDAGATFGQAQKLGYGSWALKGCPMDGGGLAIDKDGSVQTVWRRESKMYGCEPGKQEVLLGEGRNCTIESVNGKNVYAWTEKGVVTIMRPNRTKSSLGNGTLPIIKAVDNEQFICVWQNENKIHASVLKL